MHGRKLLKSATLANGIILDGTCDLADMVTDLLVAQHLDAIESASNEEDEDAIITMVEQKAFEINSQGEQAQLAFLMGK